MNKGKPGFISIIFGIISMLLGCVSLFCLFMLALENSGPGIFIGSMLIAAICFGVVAIIRGGLGRVLASIGVWLSLLGLMFTFNHLFGFKSHYDPGYKDVRFLGNGNTVGLRYCNSYKNCFIKYTYDVSTQKFSRQEANNKLDTYSFSRDGSKILFVDGSEDEKNIFVMNADGSEKRQLTYSSDRDTVVVRDDLDTKLLRVKTNSCPSFAPDGERAIFVRHTLRLKKRSGFSDSRNCDIYEINIETGVERKLTNHNFYTVSCPRYLSDGKRFVFAGYLSDYRSYNASYKDNFIFIMDENNKELMPAIMHSSFSSGPSVSFDDTIAYVANPDDDGHYPRQVFIKSGDETRQLTYIRSMITASEISSDGRLIAYKEERATGKNEPRENHFWVMKSDGTNPKELVPPKD